MSLSSALELATLGFHVFPLVPNSKLPLIEDFPRRATRDATQLRDWWLDPVMGIEQPYNVGISTSRFGDNEALIVVDVDNKGDKDGDSEIVRLELEGLDFPPTFEQSTPTGGRHLVYRVAVGCRNSVDELGRGLDIRSKGGFVVGAGSVTEHGTYTTAGGTVAAAPAWLVTRLSSAVSSSDRATAKGVESPVSSRAAQRATEYLVKHAPLAVEGAGGDHTAFKVACRLKDFGVDEATACELMFERWNNRCSPPWTPELLAVKVANAYAYGENEVGVDDPAAQFTAVDEDDDKPDWVTEMNKRYCVVNDHGKTLVFMPTYSKPLNREVLERTTFEDLKKMYLNDTIGEGKKIVTRAEAWLSHPKRRQYIHGVEFAPGEDLGPGTYNLWRGFAVQPKKGSWTKLRRHIHDIICSGDSELDQYVMGWIARLIQRPGEQGEVALVFKGKRGVGKGTVGNVLLRILGQHGIYLTQSKHLVGNFNAHLRDAVLVFADEAFYAGDKQNESALKGLITDPYLTIEGKYQNAVTTKNVVHLLMASNEGWVVPAGEDERRYCVLEVSDRYKQDHAYFESIYQESKSGGMEAMLYDLLRFDLSNFNVRQVPHTSALLDQKIRSLKPLHQWWFESLINGRVSEGDFEWSRSIEKNRLRDAFSRYLERRHIGGWVPDEVSFGKALHECMPSMKVMRKRSEEGERMRFYELPSLAQARKEWDEFVGHPKDWEPEDLTEEERVFA